MINKIITIILFICAVWGQAQNLSVDELIKYLNLEPHPAGGLFFRQTYKSNGVIPKSVLPKDYQGDRSYNTLIYSLLPEGVKLKFHKLLSDETLHFYMGGPMKIVQISPKGEVEEIVLGQEFFKGNQLQHVIPAGFWFGMYNLEGSKYSLYGASVSPGFEYDDFIDGNKEQLLKQFPNAKSIINFIME
mgnify:CR=1 FL=1|jgi:hypothetical protein|tara:strand:- start:212 stop:775 length:564 start_codon:yes stop_codon:yes gene_type:complete